MARRKNKSGLQTIGDYEKKNNSGRKTVADYEKERKNTKDNTDTKKKGGLFSAFGAYYDQKGASERAAKLKSQAATELWKQKSQEYTYTDKGDQRRQVYAAKMISDTPGAAEREKEKQKKKNQEITKYWQDTAKDYTYTDQGDQRGQVYAAKMINDTPGALEREQKRQQEQLDKYLKELSSKKMQKGYQGYSEYKDEQKENGVTGFGVKSFIGPLNEKQNKVNLGTYNAGTDPYFMNLEGLENYIESNKKAAEEAKERPAGSRSEQMAGLFDVLQGYDRENVRDSRQRDAVAEAQKNSEQQRQEVYDKANEYFGTDLDTLQRLYLNTDNEVERNELRKEIFDAIMPVGYDEWTATLTEEQTTEIDKQLDSIIRGDKTVWQENEEAKIYSENVKESENVLQFRKDYEKVAGWAEESGFSGNYNPEYVSTIKEMDNFWSELYDVPVGSEADKAYYFMNNLPEPGSPLNGIDHVSKYYFATPEMVKQYNKLYEDYKTYGSNMADMFLKGIDTYLNHCMSVYHDYYIRSKAEEPVAGTVLKVMSPALNMTGAAASAVGMGNVLLTGLGLPGIGDENALDQNSKYYMMTNIVQTGREQINKNLAKLIGDESGATEFLLNVGDSISDNLLAMGVGGFAAGGAASKPGMRIIQAIMSSEAAANTMLNKLEENYDPIEAATYAIGDGAIEWITERVSLETILNPNVRDMDFKSFMKYLGKAGLAEGSEEVNADLLNWGFDSVMSMINGHEDELQKQYRQLVNQGVDPTQAGKQVLKQKWEQIGLSFLAGMISGWGMSMGYGAANRIGIAKTGKNVNDSNKIDQLAKAAAQMSQDTTSYELGQKLQSKLESGKKISNYDAGLLAITIINDTNEQIGNTARTVLEDRVAGDLEGKNVERESARDLSRLIVKALENGGIDNLSAEERRTINGNQAALNTYMDYRFNEETQGKTQEAIKESTKTERGAQSVASTLISKPETQNKLSRTNRIKGTYVISEKDSDYQSAEGEKVNGPRGVIVYDKDKVMHAKLDSLVLDKENDRLMYQVTINGETQLVEPNQIRTTNPGMGVIIESQAVNPGFYSQAYVNQMIFDMEQPEVMNQPGNYMIDATAIRYAAFQQTEMPHTVIGDEFAKRMYNMAQSELKSIRENETKDAQRNAHKAGEGSATFMEDTQYGTKEFDEAVDELNVSDEEKNDIKTQATLAVALGMDVRFVDNAYLEKLAQQRKDLEQYKGNMSEIYGEESQDEILINIEGENYGRNLVTGEIEAQGKHNINVTSGHEFLHWLRRNSSIEAYDNVAKYVLDTLRKSMTTQGLNEAIADYMDKQGLTLDRAIDELIADSCDSIFTNKNVLDHVQNTNQSLYGKVKSFVQDLFKRARTALSSMYSSMSAASRRMINTDMRKLGELVNVAWDEAVSRPAEEKAEGTENGTARYSKIGEDPDTGRPVYVSNYAQGTEKSIKQNALISLIQDIWSKKPIQLTIQENGKDRTIYAQYNPDYDTTGTRKTDVGKMAFPEYGPASSRRVMLNLSNDYRQILEESTYQTSANEEKGRNHIKQWHYFADDIYYADQGSDEAIPYRIDIDIKEQDNGTYVYRYKPTELKNEQRKKLSLMGLGPVNTGVMPGESASASEESITEKENNSNNNISEEQTQERRQSRYSPSNEKGWWSDMDEVHYDREKNEYYTRNTKTGKTVTLEGLDREYAEAWFNGDRSRMEEILMDKIIEADAVPFKFARPYSGQSAEWIANNIKKGDMAAIRQAAAEMAPKVAENAVLIPMPDRTGKVTENTDTMLLAQEISRITGRPVVNALEGVERESRQTDKGKKKSKQMKAEDLGFRKVAEISEGTIPYFIDNLVAAGVTAEAAHDAFGTGITLAYAKGIRAANQGLKNAEVTFYDKWHDGQYLIPLHDRIDMEQKGPRAARFSRWTEQGMDVNYWMEHATPGMVQTEDERALLDAYRGKRISMSLSLKKQSDYRSKIRQLEEKAELSTDQKSELTALKNKLEIERNKFARLEDEIFKITRTDGWAGAMYQHNMVFRDYIEGKTQDQVRKTVDEMVKKVEETREQIRRDTESLKKLAETQAVKTMKSVLGKTSLGVKAAQLKSYYNTGMTKGEISDRLAEMVLTQAQGKDITADAEMLAREMMEKMRGVRSDTLNSLKGTTLVIGRNILNQLKAEHTTLAEIRQRIKGSGITIKTEENSRLDSQWEELRENNQSLPDISGLADADKLHAVAGFIESELRASTGSEQYDVDIDEAALFVKAMVGNISTFLTDDPKARHQIDALIKQIQELHSKTEKTAADMEALDSRLDEVIQAGQRAQGMASTLENDVNEAIKYYNTTARVAAENERNKVRQNLIKQLRSETAQKLLKQQEAFNERLKNDRKTRELAQENLAIRRKISTVATRMANRIFAETDQKNIPEETKSLARQVLNMLSEHDEFFRKVTYWDKQQVENIRERLGRMKGVYGEFKPDTDLNWLIHNPGPDEDDTAFVKVTQDLINIESGLLDYRNAEGLGTTTLQDRKAALTKVQEALSEIWNVIQRRSEAEIEGRRWQIYDLAEMMREDFAYSRFKGERKGFGTRTRNLASGMLTWGNLTPEYFFKMLRNKAMDLLHNGLKDAENRSGLEFGKAKLRLAEIAAKTGFSTWDGQEEHKVKTRSGEITMTTEQLMALYATWLREKNQMRPEETAHLLHGGFVLAENEDNTGKPGRVKKNVRPIRISEAQLNALGQQLTEAQREYVHEMVKYMSTELAELGNEASMRMYGIKKFTEQYYFPIKSWGGVLNQRSDAGVKNSNENRAAQQGFSKRVKNNARNAIEISDFTPTAVKHVAGMITYNTVAPAIENLNKVLNQQLTYGEIREDENGEELDDTYKRNMRAAFEEAYGKQASDYLATFMQDMNGGTTQTRTPFDKLLSVFKKNAVAGSLSVAAQQPLSYIRAAMLVNPKYLAQAISPAYWKGSWEEMMQWSGIAVIKEMGKFDMNYGQSAQEWITPEGYKTKARKAWNKTTDALTELPHLMDTMTWTRMWTAVKLEQMAQNKGMDYQSDEFMQKVARRFNDLMRQTQVYDSVMTKSQNMRNKDWKMRSITSFMAEPTLTLNVLADAWQNIGEKGGKKKAITALVTFLLSAAAQAGAKGYFSTGRSPDKKKNREENFLNKFAASLISELNPLGLIPGYSALIDVMTEGEVTDDAMGMIGKAMDVFENMYKMITQWDFSYRNFEDSVGQLMQLVSKVPLKNMMRDFRAMVNFFSNGSAEGLTGNTYAKRPTDMSVVKYSLLETLMKQDLIGAINKRLGDAGYGTANTDYYQRIYEAEKAGNQQAADEMRGYLEGGRGTKPETIDENLRKIAKGDSDMSAEEQVEYYQQHNASQNTQDNIVMDGIKNGTMSAEEARKLLKQIYPEKSDNDIWWTVDRAEWTRDKGLEKTVSGQYYRFKDAIENGKQADMDNIVKTMIQHGMKKENIINWIGNTDTGFKPAYLSATGKEKDTLRLKLIKAYKAAGLTEQEAIKKINDWKTTKKKDGSSSTGNAERYSARSMTVSDVGYGSTDANDTTGRYGRGNIDLNNRQVVRNKDGSISTERSFSVNIDGKEVLLPTVINGRIVSENEAINHYLKTGEYLGKFNTVKEADEYAEKLHNRQDWYYNR